MIIFHYEQIETSSLFIENYPWKLKVKMKGQHLEFAGKIIEYQKILQRILRQKWSPSNLT